MDTLMHNSLEKPLLNSNQIALLKRTKLAEYSENDQDMFVEVCQQLRLNPFTGQINAIRRSVKGEARLSIEPSLDGLLVIADRTGKYDGCELAWADDETGEDGEPIWRKAWLPTRGDPSLARAIVYRNDHSRPEIQTASWASYAQSFKGELGHFWNKHPVLMLAKCALALALRRKFPDEMGGLATTEEISEDNVKDETAKKDYKLDKAKTVVPVKTAPPATPEETELREEAKTLPKRSDVPLQKDVQPQEERPAQAPEDSPLSEPEAGPEPEPAQPAYLDHVIRGIKDQRFFGRKVRELSAQELDKINAKWIPAVMAQKDVASPEQLADAEALLAAIAAKDVETFA